jgi:DNA-binding NarL/FixJ family response regulator
MTGCDIAPVLSVNGVDHSFEMQARTKHGELRWLAVNALAFTDADRRTPFIVHVLQDVTSRKHLHAFVRERVCGPLASPAGALPPAVLTPRELEVLRLLAAGAGTAASAKHLGLSRATIRNHVQNIFGKLGVHTRLEAVAYATRHRLL